MTKFDPFRTCKNCGIETVDNLHDCERDYFNSLTPKEQARWTELSRMSELSPSQLAWTNKGESNG